MSNHLCESNCTIDFILEGGCDCFNDRTHPLCNMSRCKKCDNFFNKQDLILFPPHGKLCQDCINKIENE